MRTFGPRSGGQIPDEMTHDHEKLANELERERADMEHQAEKLEDEIDEVRDEWRRRRDDPAVPGAEPREEERDTGPSETQREPGGPSG
jgi:chromosome segregation ATPase